MKFYIASEQRHIDIDQSFTLNDIQYPAGYLRGITHAERAAMGLQEVVEVGVRESQNAFLVTEELVGAELRITSIPKPEPSEQEKILRRIKELEDQCNYPRLIREATLGISESVQILSGIQTLIEAERIKLRAL